MRIAILSFTDANTLNDTVIAVKRAGMEPVELTQNNYSSEKLAEMAGYVLVGELSDASCSALSPLMQLIEQQSTSGKPILGLGFGAQVLIETSLAPGVKNFKLPLALINTELNNHAHAYIRLSDHYQYNAFTRYLTPDTILSIPAALVERHFVIPPGLLSEMRENGLDVFHYCDASGKITADLPVAAVSNKAGNIMAMMPSPTHSDALFQSMREYIAEGYKQQVMPLYYHPPFS